MKVWFTPWYLLFFSAGIYSVSLPTLVLDPGHGSDTYFTQEAYEWATALRHELQKKFPKLRLCLSHGMQEKVTQDQIAAFANRLQPVLFISLHLSKQTQPALYTYTRVDHPVTDYWYTSSSTLSLLPTAKAHTVYAKTSRALSQKLVTILKKQSSFVPCVEKACGIPCKSLYGIQTPALTLDLALSKAKEWRTYLIPLVEALTEVITPLMEKVHS